MIDRAYKNYFAELNSLDSQSRKIKEILKRIKDFKIYSNNVSKLGNSSFSDEKSNFLNLNINYKNFENELDDLFNRIIDDKRGGIGSGVSHFLTFHWLIAIF